MSGIQTYIPTALEVTDRAVEKVQSLKTEEQNDDLKLRVYVTGGGVLGFSMASRLRIPWRKMTPWSVAMV